MYKMTIESWLHRDKFVANIGYQHAGRLSQIVNHAAMETR